MSDESKRSFAGGFLLCIAIIIVLYVFFSIGLSNGRVNIINSCGISESFVYSGKVYECKLITSKKV